MEEKYCTNLNSELFERAKKVYKLIEETGVVRSQDYEDIGSLMLEFRNLGDMNGVVFCHKATAIMNTVQGDVETIPNLKVVYYEKAHSELNEAVLLAKEIGWKAPSLWKWQGTIKVKLSDSLHRVGSHHDANILMRDGLRILNNTVKDTRNYASGHLAYTEAQVIANYWRTQKLMMDIRRANDLVENTKVGLQPDEFNRLGELQTCVSACLDAYGSIQ